MIVRSKAPLRISFAGGGTDVSPYFEQYGGAVLSTTINKFAYATLSTREDQDLTVSSLDYDIVA
ncbi:MAG TPA: GHMP kinase, partial [Armatimonadota bacterium]|nr:GHMP kinase [Armatimonadota bacterium]